MSEKRSPYETVFVPRREVLPLLGNAVRKQERMEAPPPPPAPDPRDELLAKAALALGMFDTWWRNPNSERTFVTIEPAMREALDFLTAWQKFKEQGK